MDFRADLSAELPAPRDDEPGGLRDDILDELTDHLACAYRRELLRGADAATARQRVLERFGDPAALARRLWFDAMKGKIMAQRILVVCCILLTVISLSLAFVTWNQAVHAHRLAALAQAEMAEDRRLQQQMLEQLQAVSKAASSTRSAFWIPVTFKLTQETPDGPPAVGFNAFLGRGNNGANKEGAIQRRTDDKGMIDFGVVQPGDWEFTLMNNTWQMSETFNVLPGTTIEKTIICPRNSPEYVPISVRVEWPPDLVESSLGVVAKFSHNGFTYQPPLRWWHTYSAPAPGRISFLCGQGSKAMVAIEPGGFSYWMRQGDGTGLPLESLGTDARGYKFGQVYLELPWLGSSGEPGSATAIQGTYQIEQLAVVRPRKELRGGFRGERCELLVLSSAWGMGVRVMYRSEPPGQSEKEPGDGINGPTPMASLDANYYVASNSYWRKPATFEVKQGQPNVWSIRLPDELTRAVRNKLKGETKK